MAHAPRRLILLLRCLLLALASSALVAACDDGGGSGGADTTLADTTSVDDTADPGDADTSDPGDADTSDPGDVAETSDPPDTDPDSTADTGDTLDMAEDVIPAGCETACEGAALPAGELLCDNHDPTLVCAVVSCAGTGADDCNMTPGDGCEQALDVPERCGSCTNDCTALANVAQASCDGAGGCGIVACAEGFADCDADPTNGCEVDTTSDPAHCGGCAMACDLTNVDAHTCSASVCGVESCDESFGDCNADAVDGCELDIYWSVDGTDCGSCGHTCALPNATETRCGAGVCLVNTCVESYLEANADPVDGCEARLVRASNDFDIYTNADLSLYAAGGHRLHLNRTVNNAKAWYHARSYLTTQGSTERFGIAGSLPGTGLYYTHANMDGFSVADFGTVKTSMHEYGRLFVSTLPPPDSDVAAYLAPTVSDGQSPANRVVTGWHVTDPMGLFDATQAIHALPAPSGSPLLGTFLVLSRSSWGTAQLSAVAVASGGNVSDLFAGTETCYTGGFVDAFSSCVATIESARSTAPAFTSLVVVELQREPDLRALIIVGHDGAEAEFFYLTVPGGAGAVTLTRTGMAASDGTSITIGGSIHTRSVGLPSASDPTRQDAFLVGGSSPEYYVLNEDPSCAPYGVCSIDKVRRVESGNLGGRLIPIDAHRVLRADRDQIAIINFDPASPYIDRYENGMHGVMTSVFVGTTLFRDDAIGWDPELQRVFYGEEDIRLISAWNLQGL